MRRPWFVREGPGAASHFKHPPNDSKFNCKLGAQGGRAICTPNRSGEIVCCNLLLCVARAADKTTVENKFLRRKFPNEPTLRSKPVAVARGASGSSPQRKAHSRQPRCSSVVQLALAALRYRCALVAVSRVATSLTSPLSALLSTLSTLLGGDTPMACVFRSELGADLEPSRRADRRTVTPRLLQHWHDSPMQLPLAASTLQHA